MSVHHNKLIKPVRAAKEYVFKMQDDELIRKNKRAGLIVLGVVCFMIALAFASAPLYNLFCRATGWGGTTQVAVQLPPAEDVIDRTITVRFDANTARDLPWSFEPEMLSTQVKLGERGLTNFIAENKGRIPVAGTAVFNVTPLKAGKYFQKIQCFCFDEQVLQPGQRVDMPVMFFVDPKLHSDRNMDDVTTITLSYSFFKAQSQELDNAIESFYNDESLAE